VTDFHVWILDCGAKWNVVSFVIFYGFVSLLSQPIMIMIVITMNNCFSIDSVMLPAHKYCCSPSIHLSVCLSIPCM